MTVLLVTLGCAAGVLAAGVSSAGVFSAGSATPARPVGGEVVTPGSLSDVTTADALSRAEIAGSPDKDHDGFTLLQRTLIGQTPSGFSVWVARTARHRSLIARTTAQAVGELRRFGTAVRWRGYGSPAATDGVVRIMEGKKGCGGGGDAVGMTWTYWHTLASGKRYAYRADVYLCPSLFRMGNWATGATVRHELGHAMGLGHTNYKYDGSYQVMNATIRRGVVHYGAGDRRGFSTLAHNTAWVKTQIPPDGHLDGSAWQDDGSIDFTGWALLAYYKTSPVTVILTDNGKVIRTSSTQVLRRDINQARDPGSRRHGFDLSVPWTGGTHNYCITARSTSRPTASARLGCVTWRG